MWFVVDGIRDAEARVMRDHLREQHHELRVSDTWQLGAVFDHFQVARTQR